MNSQPSSPPSSSSNVQSTWSKIKNLRRSDGLQPPLSTIFRIGLSALPDANTDDLETPMTAQSLSELITKDSDRDVSGPYNSKHLDNSSSNSDSKSVPGSPANSSSAPSQTNHSHQNHTDGDSDTDEQASEVDHEVIRQLRVLSTDSLADDVPESGEPAPGFIPNSTTDSSREAAYTNRKVLTSSASNCEAESCSHNRRQTENELDVSHQRDSTPEDTMINIVQTNSNNLASGISVATSSSTNVITDDHEMSDPMTEAPPKTSRQKDDEEHPFSIRLTPFVDHSSFVPSRYISVMERKLKEGGIIKVGRYSDRREADERAISDNQPIVFKSKVVSRSHAEIFVKDGVWCVKDVRSSSGTFLNHVRLSPACQPSTAHQLKDGDFLQLGMDFRGGSEELYKCIKVRVELNKSWRKKANDFNLQALSSLRTAYQQTSDEHNLQECAICLLPVQPCQALFVAPCSHAWHYKCVRPLVVKTYPHFMCPNCRSLCDLEADVEELSETEN